MVKCHNATLYLYLFFIQLLTSYFYKQNMLLLISLQLPNLTKSMVEEKTGICEICGEQFSSRSKMFKHLQTVHGLESSSVKLPKIILIFGWISSTVVDCSDEWSKETCFSSTVPIDEVERQIFSCINMVETGVSNCERPKGYSRSSRPPQTSSFTLGLDKNSHSCCDIMSFQAKPLIHPMNDSLWVEKINSMLPESIRIFRRITLPSSSCEFHAEFSTTQRVLEFMLPLDVVMPPELIESLPTQEKEIDIGPVKSFQIHSEMERIFPRNSEEGKARVEFFRRLKRILRQFGENGRKSFHNYACGGGTIPDDSLSRRRVDRFYHKELIAMPKKVEVNADVAVQCTKDSEETTEPWVVFSISGDDFLIGQARRMIGLSIAILRGWLPESYITHSFESYNFLEVPAVPGLGCYLAECKFAIWESKHDGNYIIPRDSSKPEENIVIESMANFRKKIQFHIVDNFHKYGNSWLHEMEAKCSQLHHQLLALNSLISRDLKEEYQQRFGQLSMVERDNKVPEVFRRVLGLLRNAEKSGHWPSTSIGRKRVIEEASLMEKGGLGGTFSVGCLPKHMKQPKGNYLFPGTLLRVVFLIIHLFDHFHAFFNEIQYYYRINQSSI